jgi:hypothetical protein
MERIFVSISKGRGCIAASLMPELDRESIPQSHFQVKLKYLACSIAPIFSFNDPWK